MQNLIFQTIASVWSGAGLVAPGTPRPPYAFILMARIVMVSHLIYFTYYLAFKSKRARTTGANKINLVFNILSRRTQTAAVGCKTASYIKKTL